MLFGSIWPLHKSFRRGAESLACCPCLKLLLKRLPSRTCPLHVMTRMSAREPWTPMHSPFSGPLLASEAFPGYSQAYYSNCLVRKSFQVKLPRPLSAPPPPLSSSLGPPNDSNCLSSEARRLGGSPLRGLAEPVGRHQGCPPEAATKTLAGLDARLQLHRKDWHMASRSDERPPKSQAEHLSSASHGPANGDPSQALLLS